MNEHPLKVVQDEIAKSVEAGLYSLPIFMAAAIPDMCAALESEDGRTSSSKYRAWFDKWAFSRMSLITAEDCYKLRCGLIHQGKLGGMTGGIKQIIFLLPSKMFARFANNRFNDTYAYSIDSFCDDMMASSNDWWREMANDTQVKENAKHVLKLHPDGWSGVVSGVPVLA